ncbi:MAG: phasin family protein [Betaproteobacteria bacterium]
MMDNLFAQTARQQFAVLDTSLAVYRAGIASFAKLAELHLAVAGASLGETSAGMLRLLAARTPEEAAGGLAEDMQPQVVRYFIYCCILREISHQVSRKALAAMPPPEGHDR